MRALGAIIEYPDAPPTEWEYYVGILDYYDNWDSIDARLQAHHEALSPAAGAFGHDLVNIATYVSEVISWLRPERIRLPQSVVSVGSMTEAFIFAARSACDAAGSALSYVAAAKPGQAPSNSLRTLADWSAKHPGRVNPAVRTALQNLEWFWALRTLRDHIVHQGADAVIHCNGRQFNLWVHSPRQGWITREPLLPFLARVLASLVAFGNDSATVINREIGMPADRVRSRTISGVLIPSLHELPRLAPEYSEASP